MNYVDNMFDITLFVSPGDLDNKAFNPQLFFEAINEIDTGTGTMDLITSLSKTREFKNEPKRLYNGLKNL